MTVNVYLKIFRCSPNEPVFPDVFNFVLTFQETKMSPVDSLCQRQVACIMPENCPQPSESSLT
jgi:hypothetical protein